MVETRSTSKRIKSGQVHDGSKMLPRDDSVELPPGDHDAPPPAKKRRREGAQAPKTLRRGKPGDLLQLNLDVLYLIAALIHPLDLLNLARTCKSFRGLLMVESSAFIWRAARRQVKGLPDCPADLSEPAYANLAFYAYCHVCGKYTAAIFWYIRRRYCTDCRVERLCHLFDCPWTIYDTIHLTVESIRVDKEHASWIDRNQMNSLMQEYELSSDKKQFLSDKQKQYHAIYDHAKNCEYWQKQMASERKDELNVCRWERDRSIVERLKQLGYEPEINYFGRDRFRQKTPKPLTDREWVRILPEWLKTMNHHRWLRLNAVVYQPRRRSLASEYGIYVTHQSPDTPAFDLLPHVIDLACFPPFRDIIKAPEETQVGGKPFASAVAQLPVLVDEWRMQLDVELAELVNIPPHLSSEDASCDLGVTTRADFFQTDSDKLRLACALFHVNACTGVFTHPEVFSTSMLNCSYPGRNENDSRRTGSIRGRFDIFFLDEAPYIVHACELDPNVATVDDLDRRNARLRCLVCKKPNTIIMNWRDAMLHAQSNHRRRRLAPVSESPRWQLVSDEYIDMIQAVEQSINQESSSSYYMRCLLCLPRVGDAMGHDETIRHLWYRHDVKMDDVKRGVHYVRLGINDACSTQVEMVEEGGRVIFRVPQYS